MDSRINISENDSKIEIVIKAFLDAKKQQMLLIWIALFSICGLAIVAQFFEDYDAGTKVFFGVYVAFWIFFEFKVLYAYRWRKYGEEKIIIEDNQFVLVKTIGKRGDTQYYELSDINEVKLFKDGGGNFSKSMNTSYWNINKYSLVLCLDKVTIPFGIDLETDDAKLILKKINKFCK